MHPLLPDGWHSQARSAPSLVMPSLCRRTPLLARAVVAVAGVVSEVSAHDSRKSRGRGGQLRLWLRAGACRALTHTKTYTSAKGRAERAHVPLPVASVAIPSAGIIRKCLGSSGWLEPSVGARVYAVLPLGRFACGVALLPGVPRTARG